jgi:hypothetical protein
MDTDSVINVLSVDLENWKIKHRYYPNNDLTKVRIEAYTKAIEVLKRFDGAVEVKHNIYRDPRENVDNLIIVRDTIDRNKYDIKLIAIPEEK